MKRTHITNRWLRWLIVLSLLISLANTAALAEATTPTLTPDDLTYEDGNIILHKHGERIGPDEWKVTVRATIGDTPVEKRQMEVVFLLDTSSSMVTNNAHTHGDTCYELTCTEHVHDDACYKWNCSLDEHTHDDDCYTRSCGKSEHTHTYSKRGGCYREKCTSDHDHAASGCHKQGQNYYALTCTQEEHQHSDACYSLSCGKTAHTHTENVCYSLICGQDGHEHTSACYDQNHLVCKFTDADADVGDYDDDPSTVTRLAVAARVIEQMIANLPKDTTTVKRLYYNGSYRFGEDTSSDGYYGIEYNSGTYTWTGIYKALSGNYFSDDDSKKKVFVLINDGNVSSNDDYEDEARSELQSFMTDDNGAVFTIGFAFQSAMLEGIAGNGGYYMYAQDADALSSAFNQMEQTLTAMLEDPMGTTVGFEASSIQQIHTSNGVISSSGDTIYWNPAEDGSTSVNNSIIEYSYTVKLNEDADLGIGIHGDATPSDDLVPLNKPTYFYYGIKNADNTTNMNEALFPIPHAEYALSSIQTSWREKGTKIDILDPTDVESVICDFTSATYIPAFEQDYDYTPAVIPIDGTNDYYRYVGTTVTATDSDGDMLDDVNSLDDVNVRKPVAYVVVHEYERINSNELVIGGTKVLNGRDFMEGDSFTFTITADDPANAPMPKDENGNTVNSVTIKPSSGTSMAFSFGTISYATAGTYTYTIQEKTPTTEAQTGMLYDVAPRTLVVTTTEVGGEIVVSYTLDGAENAPLVITNRLDTGSLEIKKNSVTSYNEAHQTQLFDFLIHLEDMSGRALSGSYPMQLNGISTNVTFVNGSATIQLAAGQSAVISELPNGATYTITEAPPGGFTAMPTNATGKIVAEQTQIASFDNTYQAKGAYQFLGLKKVDGATLENDQYSFVVKDASETVVARGKNNTDGNIFFSMLEFTEADIGTKTYTIAEEAGSIPGIIYDKTVHTVTLTIADNGDGTLSITSSHNNTKLPFTNKYIASQLSVSKTVDGNMGSKNQAFSFTISLPDMANKPVSFSTDGGATYSDLPLPVDGTYTCTLKHGESIIFYPITGDYTVTENDPGSYSTNHTINGEQGEGAAATGTMTEAGVHVAFTNTLDVPPPTGIRTSSASALMGLCLAAGLLAILFAGRRSSCHAQ